MTSIVPAILPKSRADLAEKLAELATLESVREVQIDAVDGRFAMPACWPLSAPREFSAMLAGGEHFPQAGRFHLEADLMTLDPEAMADSYLALGATRVTIHTESTHSLERTLAEIRARHDLVTIGVALGMVTDLACIAPVAEAIHYIQFMGIAHIGHQGEPFDRRVLERVKAAKRAYPLLPVQVDGGVSLATAPFLIAAGADRLVVGSALWRASDLALEIGKFEELAQMRW